MLVEVQWVKLETCHWPGLACARSEKYVTGAWCQSATVSYAPTKVIKVNIKYALTPF